MGFLEGMRCVWGRKGGGVMGFLEGIRCVGGCGACIWVHARGSPHHC